MINAALEDTAAVAVRGYIYEVARDGVENELRVSGSKLLKTTLNDVVAVQILDEWNDVVAQRPSNHLLK